MSFLAALVAFCPCFSGTVEAMEDCCPPTGISADGGCCDNDARTEAVVSPAVPPASMTPPLPTSLAAAQVVSFVVPADQAVAAHPRAARAILRI